MLDQNVELYVSINFFAVPPSFNNEGFIVPALKCSDEDLYWEMKLPPVDASDLSKVRIGFAQPNNFTDLFIFREVDVIVLASNTLQDFF